jgi:hypothetical protein
LSLRYWFIFPSLSSLEWVLSSQEVHYNLHFYRLGWY